MENYTNTIEKNKYIRWNRITRLSSFYLFASFLFLLLLVYFTLDFVPTEDGLWRVVEGEDYPEGWDWLYSLSAVVGFGSLVVLLFFLLGSFLRSRYRKKIGLSIERLELSVSDGTEFISWFYIITTIIYLIIPVDLYLSGEVETSYGAYWQLVDPLLIIGIAALYFRKNLSLMHWGKFHNPKINLLEIGIGYLVIFFLLEPVFAYVIEHFFHLSNESFRNNMISEWVKESKEVSLFAVLLQFISLAVLTPIAEEILCRGVIHRTFANRFGVWVGAIVSSIFFAALHVDIVAALPIFVFSLYLSYVYERSKSLWAPILLHGINNGVYVAVTLWG